MTDLKAVREALGNATQGKWYWYVSLKGKFVRLCAKTRMIPIVMDFVRFGMQSAKPRFNNDMIMVDADTLVETDHNGVAYEINHPDAHLIANAPEWLREMASEIEQYRAMMGLDDASPLAEMKARSDGINSLAAQQAYINALETHLLKLRAENAHLKAIVSDVDDELRMESPLSDTHWEQIKVRIDKYVTLTK